MNLLDQKLKDKLLLFNNIDKETLPDNNTPKATHMKTKAVCKQQKKEDPFQNISKKQYDIIYSNFINKPGQGNHIPIAFMQNSQTPKGKITNQCQIPTESHRIKSTQSRSHSRSPSRSLSKGKEKTLPNNSGERLYNYGFYIRNKLDQQRKTEEDQIQRLMTPKILPRSQKIDRENLPIEERLYNLNKTTTSEQLMEEERRKESHIPQLNKNSLLIAERLEPSSLRLLKKKQRKRASTPTELYEDRQTYQSTTTTPKSSKRLNELYTKGIETMQKREQVFQEQKMKNEEEYKKFSYKPKITKSSSLIENNIIRKGNHDASLDGDEIYKKHCDWKKKVNKQLEKKMIAKEEKIQKDCTFKPEIIQKNIKNDEQFILKNVDQMNQYVTKRREVLQKKKEYEEYKNQRLGHSSHYSITPTIPKQFQFQTESRSHSREKKIRKKDDKSIRMIKEQCPLIQIPMMNNYPAYDYNSFTNEDDQKEMFLHAVNALHSQIDKLNI